MRGSKYGNAVGNFALDNVHCDGNEKRLEDCQANEDDDCKVSEVAGVYCF